MRNQLLTNVLTNTFTSVDHSALEMHLLLVCRWDREIILNNQTTAIPSDQGQNQTNSYAQPTTNNAVTNKRKRQKLSDEERKERRLKILVSSIVDSIMKILHSSTNSQFIIQICEMFSCNGIEECRVIATQQLLKMISHVDKQKSRSDDSLSIVRNAYPLFKTDPMINQQCSKHLIHQSKVHLHHHITKSDGMFQQEHPRTESNVPIQHDQSTKTRLTAKRLSWQNGETTEFGEIDFDQHIQEIEQRYATYKNLNKDLDVLGDPKSK